jgi:hypothetical protein
MNSVQFLSSVNDNSCFHGQNVGIRAKSGYLTAANRSDQRSMTEFLPRMDVGQMDLNRRNPDCCYGIPKGDARMGIGCGVQDDDVELALGFLNPGNQFAFEVGLAELDSGFELGGPFPDFGFDIGQGGAAIDLRLPLAKEIKVWTI